MDVEGRWAARILWVLLPAMTILLAVVGRCILWRRTYPQRAAPAEQPPAESR